MSSKRCLTPILVASILSAILFITVAPYLLSSAPTIPAISDEYRDRGLLRLSAPPLYVVAAQSDEQGEVPPLPLDKIRIMAWYRVPEGELDLSKAAAAFKQYEWHGSYIEGTIEFKYRSLALHVSARARSDGVVVVWVPKGASLANAFFYWSGLDNLLEKAIASILKAAGIESFNPAKIIYYCPEYPDANVLVVIAGSEFSYTIPQNVKPIAAFMLLEQFNVPYLGFSIDGKHYDYKFEYATPPVVDEVNLSEFYSKWSLQNFKHEVDYHGKRYLSNALVMVVLLKAES